MQHWLKQRFTPKLTVKAVGPLSTDYREEIDRAIQRMPFWMSCVLNKKGWRVILSRQMLEGFGEFKHLQPRGWRKGSTFNELDGCCYHQDKGIVLTEYRYDPWRKATMKSTRSTYILFHEAGHAIDACMHISTRKEFKRAFLKDVARMRRCDRRFMKYQIQYESRAGRSEAFADLFAALMGEGPYAHYMLSWFRDTTDYIQRKIFDPCSLFMDLDRLQDETFDSLVLPETLTRLKGQRKKKLSLLHPLKLEAGSYIPFTQPEEIHLEPKAPEHQLQNDPLHHLRDDDDAMAAMLAELAAGDVDERMFRSA